MCRVMLITDYFECVWACEWVWLKTPVYTSERKFFTFFRQLWNSRDVWLSENNIKNVCNVRNRTEQYMMYVCSLTGKLRLKAGEGIQYGREEDWSTESLKKAFDDYCPVQNIPYEQNPFFTCVEKSGLYTVVSSVQLQPVHHPIMNHSKLNQNPSTPSWQMSLFCIGNKGVEHWVQSLIVKTHQRFNTLPCLRQSRNGQWLKQTHTQSAKN